MKWKYVWVAAGAVLLMLCADGRSASWAVEKEAVGKTPGLRVEVPVTLERAKVVFNMDHLAFSGDMPVGIKYMHLLALRLEKMGVKGHIVGVFHGEAAYMTLNDKTYNAVRKVDTGNPYKGPIAELIRQGVQVEECVVSMKAHGWVNADLLPGVKVNGGAVARLVQLGQEGYVQIQP